MNAWQRFVRAVRFEAVDRVPVALLGTSRFFASLAGLTAFECLHDPHKLIRAEKMAFERFPEVTFVPGCWPDYGVSILSAFGCRINFPRDYVPGVVGSVIKGEDDIDELPEPNPRSDGFMPWYLKTLEYFVSRRREFGQNLNFAWSLGPGEIASYLWGMTDFLINIKLNPRTVKKLLGKLTNFIIAWLMAQMEITGDVPGILLTDDVSGLISNSDYREFLRPHHEAIRRRFPGKIFIFHCDTGADHVLESFADWGADVLNLGYTTDLAGAKSAVGKRVCLMGNIDPIGILRDGSPSEVENEVLRCLDDAMDGGGFLLSAGGGLNDGTPAENIDALVDAVKIRGRY